MPSLPAESGKAEGEVGASGDDFPQLVLAADALPKQIVEHLGQIDKTLQRVLITAQAQRVSKDEVARQAIVLSQKKLAAAEQLAAIASDPLNKELAVLAKMEAYSHLASLNDEKAAAELRKLASASSNFESQLVAHQAALVMLGLELSDLAAGLHDAQPVLHQVDVLLDDAAVLKLPDFHACAQVVQVLEQHNMSEAAEQVRAKVVSAFENHPDPQIAMKTWYLQVGSRPEFTRFQELLADGDAPASLFQPALQAVLGLAPNQWSLAYLLQNVTQVEYSGQVDKAGLMVSAIQDHREWVKLPELQQGIEDSLSQFQRRVGAIGRPMDFTGLNLVAQGQPVTAEALKGKVILVDFWASWCQPCRAEFPNMREQYQKYRDRGFEIVGINLDQDPAAMEGLLQREQLPWIQARSSDPQAVATKTLQAVEYGVGPIPFMMLVGADGKIMAVHTRGPVLNQKLSEIFP
jgi:thiol-disulfide isomerase/thioredoxin